MQIISEAEAAQLIEDGMTVTAPGFSGYCHPEAVSAAVERRFLAEGAPRDLTLLFAAASGDGRGRGMGHYGFEGLTRRVIAAGWRATPNLGRMALDEKIEAHCWPQGVVAQMYRAVAAGQPGVITRIGLGSFMDPRVDGGRLNRSTPKSLVEPLTLAGKEWLFYPAIPIDCAILRGTTADEDGNISMEDEAFWLDALAMAQAARNSGGTVIVQVKKVVPRGELAVGAVQIPGFLVDYVVVAQDPSQHGVNFNELDNPTYTGRERVAAHSPPPTPLTPDKVIQRRAFLEMLPLDRPVINLGVGIAAGVGRVANEERYAYDVTVESGVIGGVPVAERGFGASVNPSAIIPQAAQFDFYDGGGLDIAFLGMAEVDITGAVNVSRFGEAVVGVGGFTNIAQSAKRVCFLGSFSTGGADIEVADGKLRIKTDGKISKIVPKVRLVSSDPKAAAPSQREIVITERAVFERRNGYLQLIEYAPGVDLRKDILDRLPKGITVADDLKLMDPSIFATSAMWEIAP
ncbi:MAG TPA: CoA-transferase [Phenylobacterium sp.]